MKKFGFLLECFYMKDIKDVKNEDLKQFDQDQGNSLESDYTFVESTEDGDELPKKDVVKKLREEVKKLQKEKEEYLTGWQRAKADYINLQKEMNEGKKNTVNLTKENVIREFLPVLDSFDMAFMNKEALARVDKEWRVGVEYIHQQFMKSLADLEVEKIDSIDVDFDPSIHQPIETIRTNDKQKDHKIEKVIQVGYKMKDLSTDKAGRVIRPARVNVYKYEE